MNKTLRERLQYTGPQNLTTRELLKLVLNTRPLRREEQSQMETLLTEYNDLRALLRTDMGELCTYLRPAKAAQLQAVLELAKRFATPVETNYLIREAEDIFRLVQPEMAYLDHEQLRVLTLNTKHRVIANTALYQGTVNSAVLRSSEILRLAVIRNCPAIVVVHNHPSGSAEPSPEDIEVTRQLVDAARLFDIDVLDHLIIGGNSVPRH